MEVIRLTTFRSALALAALLGCALCAGCAGRPRREPATEAAAAPRDPREGAPTAQAQVGHLERADRERAPPVPPVDRDRAKTRTGPGLDRVRAFADVKEGDDETRVTISDSMLFPREGARLLPTARAPLDDVARAIVQAEAAGRASGVTITTLARTEDLARRRAIAVRDELAARGVAADTVAVDPHGGIEDARVEILVTGTDR